jgi:hypothetical protein
MVCFEVAICHDYRPEDESIPEPVKKYKKSDQSIVTYSDLISNHSANSGLVEDKLGRK